jgi:septal ring factor EnvC (AmiA/AmiB activator)
MKWAQLFLVFIFSMLVSTVFAAEKNKTLVQLDAARSAVETASAKIGGNKDAAADLERARTALKQADESFNAGKSMFGFGDISPETEKEIKVSVDAAEIATASALSKVEFIRATTELETIEKQFATVKAKLKLFEDRKAELERLRLEVAACRKISNDFEVIKLEKANLAAQVDQLNSERSRADKLKIEQLELSRKLEELMSENSRLSSQLEKQSAELKATLPPAITPEDLKKKPVKKP